jgi:hypothetical protein
MIFMGIVVAGIISNDLRRFVLCRASVPALVSLRAS